MALTVPAAGQTADVLHRQGHRVEYWPCTDAERRWLPGVYHGDGVTLGTVRPGFRSCLRPRYHVPACFPWSAAVRLDTRASLENGPFVYLGDPVPCPSSRRYDLGRRMVTCI